MELNGYTLKAVKMMETPNGISFTGDIYHDGKMIGDAYNSGNGGMTHVSLRPEHRDHYPVLDENFVERLFTLNDYESIFKDHMKDKADKGLAIITYANPFDLDFVVCGKDETAEGVTAGMNKSNPGREIESVEIFRALDDFIINDRDAAVCTAEPETARGSEKESVVKKLREAKQAPTAPKPKTARNKSEPEL